ncbi:FecR family protein [Kordia periserrulae]|uniref:FecR family protein n=1 Tax=Kordia periserrulae TaxID=701523 RepID=A0A2T6C1S4_9FLAO|nr:FecR family protein [Kordia periserrulae]PTX62259.1 FecR family protein [Kordia periserrulae]
MIEKRKLLKKLVNNTITAEEKAALESWVLEKEENLVWFKDELQEIESATTKSFDTEKSYAQLIQKIQQRERFSIKMFYKYAAAVLILISVSYLVFTNMKDEETTVVVKEQVDSLNDATKNEIIITLADGTQKTLKESTKEAIKDKHGNIVASGDGTTLNFTEDSKVLELVYNTITIPRGRTLQLNLSDGSKVWLNAGTEFRFPQNFNAEKDHRTVFLKGEAFFDVESDKNKPFIVNSNEIQVEVLGTQFNVSSYDNENKLTTTLVEGSIAIAEKDNTNTTILTPSHQAVFDKKGKTLHTKKVNTKIYTSWMDNVLIIDNYTFSEILKRLERKFDVKIVNASSIENESGNYKGEFSYNDTIEDILYTISLSKPFKYTKTNETITISDP